MGNRFKYILGRCFPALLWIDFFLHATQLKFCSESASLSFISAFKTTRSINKELFLLSFLHHSLSYAFIFFININGKLFSFLLR